MGYATPGRPGPAGATPSTGCAAPAGWPADVRRRAADAGVSEFSVAVVADLSARRAARPTAHADPWATAALCPRGQLRTLERILARGPRRAGYPTGLRTGENVRCFFGDAT